MTTLSKFAAADTDVSASAEWQRLHAVADAHVDPYALAIEQLLAHLSSKIRPLDVERMLRSVGLSGIIDALPLDEVFDVQALLDLPVTKAVDDSLANTAAERTLDVMVRASNVVGLSAGSFTRTNPLAVAFARQQVGLLVQQIGNETRVAIRQVIAQSVSGQYPVTRSAQLISSSVGMHSRQAQAMVNYERALRHAQAGGSPLRALRYHEVAVPPGTSRTDAAAMSRAARRRIGGADRRFTVSNLTDAKIDKMVRTYGERAVRYRSKMIARTETMKSANRGLTANWRLAAERGHISTASRRVWETTPDERLCDICAPMGGKTVGLWEDFVSNERGLPGQPLISTSDLTTSEPPIHPNCRCTMYLDAVPGT